MCLAQGHIAVTPVRLDLRPLGLESSTLPLSNCSPLSRIYNRKLHPVPPSLHTTNKCRSVTGSELQVKEEHARIQRGDRGSGENHNFDRFLQKLAFGRPPTPWKKVGPLPHPVTCWTPSGTLENYCFPKNKPSDPGIGPLCKTVK